MIRRQNLILGGGRNAAVSKDGHIGASWFETAQAPPHHEGYALDAFFMFMPHAAIAAISSEIRTL